MQTQFLIYVGEQENLNLRISCNDVLIYDINIADDDYLVLTKPVDHEAGNYMYNFSTNYQDLDGVIDEQTPCVLLNVLIDGKPFANFVDSLTTPDVGWIKNNLWKNDKAQIFPSQPQSLQITLRGEYVLLDNQTPLRPIKALNRLTIDPFIACDSSQTMPILYKDTNYQMCAIVDGFDLCIKKQSLLSDTEANKVMSQKTITCNEDALQFIDEALITFQSRQCLREYYDLYLPKKPA